MAAIFRIGVCPDKNHVINININMQGQIIYTQLIKYFIAPSILSKSEAGL
jgi:hypothetical protein